MRKFSIKGVDIFKKWIVTSALPYANGEMHIGHIRSTYLPADIFTRFLKLKGIRAYHVCGTDEHGTPILARALREKKSPKEITDYYHSLILHALNGALIHFDIFSRTTISNHEKLTQWFYAEAKKAGYIYKKEVKILYCEVDKIALPDRLVKGTCPFCGAPDQYGDYCEVCGRTYNAFQLKDPKCSICGATPVVKYSKHAFFNLSAFTDKLSKWVKEKLKLTKGAREHVLHWIKDGLRDWDITRDISWGVPVPDIPDQVFYVWWDAPIGYITFTSELFNKIGERWEDIWIDGTGKITHFIGKDIIYHHVLFWPAMLMSVGFTLPDEIRVRGFATLEGKKMSKSRGLYISLEEFINMWPAEYLRFYWSSSTTESLNDGDFSLREFEERINKLLIGVLGNFINRVLILIRKGKISRGVIDQNILSRILNLKKTFLEKVEDNQLDIGIKVILEMADIGNKYLSQNEPWKDLKSTKASDTLVTTFAIVYTILPLLAPYLPESTIKLSKMLGLDEYQVGTFLDITPSEEIIADKITLFREKGFTKPLFQKISKQDMDNLRKKLGL